MCGFAASGGSQSTEYRAGRTSCDTPQHLNLRATRRVRLYPPHYEQRSPAAVATVGTVRPHRLVPCRSFRKETLLSIRQRKFFTKGVAGLLFVGGQGPTPLSAKLTINFTAFYRDASKTSHPHKTPSGIRPLTNHASAYDLKSNPPSPHLKERQFYTVTCSCLLRQAASPRWLSRSRLAPLARVTVPLRSHATLRRTSAGFARYAA